MKCNEGPTCLWSHRFRKNLKPWHYLNNVLILRVKICVLRRLLLKASFPDNFTFSVINTKSLIKVSEKTELNHHRALTEIGDLSWALNEKWKLLDETENAIRGKENMSQVIGWDRFVDLTNMSIEEDFRLCQVLRAKLKEIPHLKLNLQNSISQSIGVLFFTSHSDCSKFFSPSQQKVLLLAGDIASYSTKQSFYSSFYPPQVSLLFTPVSEQICFVLFLIFQVSFILQYSLNLAKTTNAIILLSWGAYLPRSIEFPAYFFSLVTPPPPSLWPSNLASFHVCGHSSFRHVLISKSIFFFELSLWFLSSL